MQPQRYWQPSIERAKAFLRLPVRRPCFVDLTNKGYHDFHRSANEILRHSCRGQPPAMSPVSATGCFPICTQIIAHFLSIPPEAQCSQTGSAGATALIPCSVVHHPCEICRGRYENVTCVPGRLGLECPPLGGSRAWQWSDPLVAAARERERVPTSHQRSGEDDPERFLLDNGLRDSGLVSGSGRKPA